MLHYPDINPVAIHIGKIQIYWYGLMYIFAFCVTWLLARIKAKDANSPLSPKAVSDLIFAVALGVILGGRIGYMFFYEFSDLVAHPLSLFQIWHGGMSFHGGLIGVLLSTWIFSRQQNCDYIRLTDFIAPFVPIGLGLGRLGNFINGELWGRVTTMPWGMIFPHVDQLPRHPSQLYELFFEGFVLFSLLWFYSAKSRPRGAVSGLFLMAYGCMRFTIEFLRQPDQQLGFIAFHWLTMGQILSIPMVMLGWFLILKSYRWQEKAHATVP